MAPEPTHIESPNGNPIPAVLPKGWSPTRSTIPLNDAFRHTSGLLVMISQAPWPETKKRWLHVSMSYANRLPTYADMCAVKAIFIGRDKQALQVFPKEERHINIHPFCLHLWCCLDGDGLPDFGKYGTI